MPIVAVLSLAMPAPSPDDDFRPQAMGREASRTKDAATPRGRIDPCGDGKGALVVDFTFVNNSDDDATSFMLAGEHDTLCVILDVHGGVFVGLR
ncbi:MAG: hypothetical protein QM713_05730 [Arachnia sp.]